VTAFDPELLDSPDRLLEADRGGLLRALASAGAQVRRAVDVAPESGFHRLDTGEVPRAVLVATDSHAPYLSNLLEALGSARAPFIDWRQATLPRWAGPADALIVTAADGRHPRLAELVAQADRRGLAIAVAAPLGSPVGAAAARHPVADLGYLGPVSSRAMWWALATPAIQALQSLGLAQVGHLFVEIADALDDVAELNRPDSSPFTGPAKLLAADLAESLPVIAGAGSLATVAARRIAGSVQLISGSTAMAASLPDDVARVGSLLEFAAAEVDFFADRAETTTAPPRLVLIGDDEPFLSQYGVESVDLLGDEAGRRAGSALAALANTRGIATSRVVVPEAEPLVRFAAAAALGEFAATYLALARGIDPSAPRLAELSH
jgi:glucose/mannose-6-phosphate isomerase